MADESNPAFPQAGSTGNLEDWKFGMSMRDYFAGQALSGFLSSTNTSQDWINKHLVKSCYNIADRMLEQRDK